MVDKDELYSNLNEGILSERLTAFKRNLNKNLSSIKKYGGLRRIVPEFGGKLAFVIGAGPSLERNFGELRKYQFRQDIAYIAVDMAVRPLMKNGIHPRYVVSCESSPIDFFYGVDTSRMHLIAFSCMSPVTVRTWKGDISFFNWMIQRPEYAALWETAGTDLGFVATGSLVTTQAAAFALGCGIAGLVLVGNDLGYSDRFYVRETVTHRGIFNTSTRLNPLETGEINRSRRASQYRIQRGSRNYYTTSQFLAAKMWLEDLFRDGRYAVYDCSDPGCSEKYVAKIDLHDFIYSIERRTKRNRRNA
ncbi:MAG: hypothetical protein A2176_12275 [Spirochaetes bacterium RBG_13_51_14]|nr:MAG: hypothetical protein A2176_12275 [Spirochaetes bacterium RBG_13_51_14]